MIKLILKSIIWENVWSRQDCNKENYKGYIYCAGLEEAKSIASEVDEQIKIAKISEYKINTKHGCSEFYNSYPEFEKISFNEEQIMKYNPEWLPKEQQIDKEIPEEKW